MQHVRLLAMATALKLLCGVPAGAQQHGEPVSTRGPQFLVATTARATPSVVNPLQVPVLTRRISVDLRGMTLETALTTIANRAGLKLVYGHDLIRLSERVHLKADEISVAAALTAVLLGAGIDIVLSPGNRATLVKRAGSVPALEPGTIVGRITDAKTGEAVRSAEIFLDNTRWRTTSDSSGRYRISDVEAETYSLAVRRLGYTKQSRRITVRAGQEDTVNIALDPVALALEELVTTATGQQRRRDLGNAITTIRADSVLQHAPIRNLTDLLENRVPGLTTQRTTGAPGDPSRLRLRGIGSVRRNNDPIVIVDGVRIYSTQSEARSGNLTNLGCPVPSVAGTRSVCQTTAQTSTATKSGLGDDLPAPSPLDQIDPNTIEKIEVFKGPSAATLYGADAANGVIVVTTKRGKPGPTRWSATMTRGKTALPGEWPEAYYRWGHDRSAGTLTICPLINLNCVQDSLVRFQALNDPNSTILGEGERTALSLTASGGNQVLTYSLTGSYDNETGFLKLPTLEAERFRTTFNRPAPEWMQEPHRLKKWSVLSNVTAQLGSTASVMLTTALSRSEQDRTTLENKLATMAGTFIDPVSGLYYVVPDRLQEISYGLVGQSSVLADYYTRTRSSRIEMRAGLNAQWLPRPGISVTGQAGMQVNPRQDERLLPYGLPTAADSGTLMIATGREVVGTFNLQGTLRKPLWWGFVFQTSVGANLTTSVTRDVVTSASRLVAGTSSITGAAAFLATEDQSNSSVYGWYVEPRLVGQRLSLSTGIRLDGGSAYGARLTSNGGSGGLLSLPKLNGSWVISEEPFFPFKSLFSSFRLRAAYGQAQVQPGPTDRLRLYTGQVGNQLLLTSLGNDELRPERAVEFEGGFDADMFDSRVMIEVAAYSKKQLDALMVVGLPPSINGGGAAVQNVGDIRNRGVELRLGFTPIQTRLFTWSAELTYDRNTNTLVKLGRGVLPNKEKGLVAGYPVASRWARPILGYADENGDGVLVRSEVQVGDSLIFMGRIMPAHKSALSTNFVLFGGAIGVNAEFNYQTGALQVDETIRTRWVLARGAADPTAPLSEQAAIVASLVTPSPTGGPPVLAQTDYGLMQDVSTFRFNSLSVNYRAPSRVARLLRAQQLTVAVQGANLGLHSTYRGKDPNVNIWSPGEGVRDTGQLPQPRTWQLSVFLKY